MYHHGHSLARLAAALLAAQALASGANVFGAGEDPERFRFELTGSAWLINSSGTIQSSGTPIDLVSDLGAQQEQPTFFGQFTFKPARKHRIVLEGTPIRLTGFNAVNRSITYRGQTFNVSDTVASSADINYFFAGYQYDVLSSPLGHLGFSVGGAYLDATGLIHSQDTGTTASKAETFGMPLAGVDARLFLLPGRKLFQVEGGLRGMGLGSYGSYLEGSISGGICLGRLAILAGYRDLNADIHSNSSTNPAGVNVKLHGPIFSLQGRW